MSEVNILDQEIAHDYGIYCGDACDLITALPDDHIGYSVFSPPFASLYTYSNSERDMGNSRSYAQFLQHFEYLVLELLRVTKPGRLVSVHCMNIPLMKQRDGVIGIRDFRGDIIRKFEYVGFVYHSEVCIWKDPVVEMQRTKSLGLLHKQVMKDSAMSRQGMPDYVCTFRKPGENPEPVSGELGYFVGENPPPATVYTGTGTRQRNSVDIWQRYASPVWMDINQSNTLQFRSARENDDERHICPLQLDVIERCVQLWSNPGDTVLSPFMGIGSEGYVSVLRERRFIGFELKQSYFNLARQNLAAAVERRSQGKLFE